MTKFKYDNVDDWKIYYQLQKNDEVLETSVYHKTYKRFANAEKAAMKLVESCPKDLRFVFNIQRGNPFFKKCDICKVTYSIKPRLLQYYPYEYESNVYVGTIFSNKVYIQYHDFNEKEAVSYSRNHICPICAKKIINYIESMKGDKNE